MDAEAFGQKLLKTPLQTIHVEFSGGSDLNRACKYILWRFMQSNHHHLGIYPHLIHRPNDFAPLPCMSLHLSFH
jgi:hypothetical protein